MSRENVFRLVFFVLIFIFFSKVNTPFLRKDDANSVRYALYAKNILRLPIQDHKLANINAVTDKGLPETSLSSKSYYLDHPPMISWITALSLKLFGDHYYSYRLLPVISSIVSVYFLYRILILLKYSNLLIILFITAFSFNPLFIEHGEILNFEPTTFVFLTISLYYFLQFKKTREKKLFAIFILSWVAALLTDWPGYFAIIPYFFLSDKNKYKLTIFLTPIIVFISNMIWFSKINFSFVKQFILDRVLFKSDIEINLINFVRHQVSFSIMNFTYLVILAFFGFIYLIFLSKKQMQKGVVLIFFYFAIGAFNVVLFLPWADTHRFWTYYLIPVVIMLSVLFIQFFILTIKSNILQKYFLIALVLIYIGLSWVQVSQRRRSKIISFRQLDNINKYKQLTGKNQKLYASYNVYQSHDGLLLRFYLDRQLQIINSEELNNYQFSLREKINDCPDDHLDISTNYQICLK